MRERFKDVWIAASPLGSAGRTNVGQSTFSSGLMAREFPVRLSAELDGVDGL